MSTAHVTITIEFADGHVEFKTYTAETTIASLKRSLTAQWRAAPNVVWATCGNGYYTNHYGAH